MPIHEHFVAHEDSASVLAKYLNDSTNESNDAED